MSQNPSQPDTAIQAALVHVIISDTSLEMWENCHLERVCFFRDVLAETGKIGFIKKTTRPFNIVRHFCC